MDPIPISLVALAIWLIGIAIGVWIADGVIAAFDLAADIFRR